MLIRSSTLSIETRIELDSVAALRAVDLLGVGFAGVFAGTEAAAGLSVAGAACSAAAFFITSATRFSAFVQMSLI